MARTGVEKLEMIEKSRQQAYGRHATEADNNYWLSKFDELDARGVEINQPDYAWLRMIGWQATGDDAALHGPYANPPSELLPYVPLHVDEGTGDHGDEGPDDAILQQIAAYMSSINKGLDDINRRIVNLVNTQSSILDRVAELSTLVSDVESQARTRNYKGTVFGYAFNIVPVDGSKK